MSEKVLETICINCPMGCAIRVEEINGEIKVTGNTCKRGEVYGKAEYTRPVRMVTSLVPYKDRVVSVVTSQPIDKSKIFEILKAIKQIKLEKEVHCNDIIAYDIAKSGADIIVTSNE